MVVQALQYCSEHEKNDRSEIDLLKGKQRKWPFRYCCIVKKRGNDRSGIAVKIGQQHEGTIMAQILSVAPVLLVRNVVASANYYRDKLGFSYKRFWGDPPAFCMVQRDGHIVMLSEAPAGADLIPHWRVVDQMWNAYFWVADVEALFAEYQRSGAKIDYDISLKPYGIKEFGVQDLDGHDIAFGQAVE